MKSWQTPQSGIRWATDGRGAHWPLVLGVGHRRERTPIMRQQRHEKMKMKQTKREVKLQPLRWRRAQPKTTTPQKKKEKAKATPLGYQKHSLAVGNQPREPKAATRGDSGNHGAVTGLGIQLGTRNLDAELSALAKKDLQLLHYP